MLNKIMFYILGIMLFLFGLGISVQGGYHDFLYDYYYSFGPNHFIPGVIVSAFGLVFILLALLKIKTNNSRDIFLICPICEATFNKKDILNNYCPNCNVQLENIEGFCNRHPEAINAEAEDDVSE